MRASRSFAARGTWTYLIETGVKMAVFLKNGASDARSWIQGSGKPEFFSNLSSLERELARRDARYESADGSRALFLRFESFFCESWRRTVGAESNGSNVLRFGVATLAELALEEPNGSALYGAVLSDGQGRRFCFAAPGTTFQVIYDARLGFDLARLLASERAFRELYSRRELTELERLTIKPDLSLLGAFFPFSFALEKGTPVPNFERALWSVRAFERITDRTFDANDVYYWERRTVEISGRTLEWIIAAPFSYSVGRPRSNGLERSAPDVDAENGAEAGTTALFTVEIGECEISLDEWQALRPGSAFATELPARELFEARVDGKPAFWVKPGVFHGQPAVQIKARIDGESVEKEKKI